MGCRVSSGRPQAAGRSRQPFAYSSAARDSNSKPTNRSSPTTHASWPGSMTYASPGPISTSVPSSCLIASRPEWTTPTWRAWQLSVPGDGPDTLGPSPPRLESHSCGCRHAHTHHIHLRLVGRPRLIRRIEVARFHTGQGRLLSSIAKRSSRPLGCHCKRRSSQSCQRNWLLLNLRPRFRARGRP